jgi:hypothetical protein
MKLELKHLAPYLPYRLLYKKFMKGEGRYFLDTKSLDTWTYEQNKIIPILRPLSDLTKEIEHNGEKFVPINKIAPLEGYHQDCLIDLTNGSNDIYHLAYSDATALLKWHFDCFRLIDKGLAIDINKLNNG